MVELVSIGKHQLTMSNATITLHAPSVSEGYPGEACLFHMGQFNGGGAPLTTPLPLSAQASNNNTNVATAVVSGLDVDIRGAGTGTTVVTISDGRPGVVPVTIDVIVVPAPAGTLTIVSQDPVRTR